MITLLKKGTILLALLGMMQVQAQHIRLEPSSDIVVKDQNGNLLPNAWYGGMNAPQFSTTDLDHDGKADLVFFDRADNSFIPYLNRGTTGTTDYEFAPGYSANFDSCDCYGWAKLIDQNCDGLEDVICGTQGSNVNVYEQVLYASDSVGFELSYKQVISHDTALGPGRFLWMFVPKSDIPAIADIDGDGDLDMLTFGVVSNYVEWHRNYAMEAFGRCDTLFFARQTSCWGHFFEANNDNSVVLHDTSQFCLLLNFNPVASGCVLSPKRIPPPDPNPSGTRHAGSTLLAMDMDGDDAFEMLLGDVSYSDMYVVHNCGRPDYGYMDSVQTSYPQTDQAIDVDLFPGAFQVDVDNDGVRDLLIAPNEALISENVEGVRLYRNYGLDNVVDFRLEEQVFLQDEGIEVGKDASPAFIDHNGDGLLDLLVANAFAYYSTADSGEQLSGIWLYENQGTSDVPEYRLVDSDFADIKANSKNDPDYQVLRDLTPTIGDLDGDGDPDMILGYSKGKFAYFRNDAAPGNPADMVLVTNTMTDSQGDSLYAQINSTPFLYDYDGDGDLDLFSGQSFGRIFYWENTGDTAQYAYTFITDTWGKVKLSDDVGSPFSGATRPWIADYDDDGTDELIVGGESGWIFVYDSIHKGLTDSLLVSDTLYVRDYGSFVKPAGAIIDSTQRFSWMIGVRRGGVELLLNRTHIPDTTVGISPRLEDRARVLVYPNPAQDEVFVELRDWQGKGDILVSVYDAMGRMLIAERGSTPKMRLALGRQMTGVYFVRVQAEGSFTTRKLLIRR